MFINDLYVYAGFSLASLIIIMKSAGFIIKALSHYAKKTGVSDYLIGFLVVSIGTSLPELTTAFMSAFSGNSSLSIGNIVGANIIDVTIILGLTSIIGKRIAIHGKMLQKTFTIVLFITLLPLIFGFDGRVSRLEGGLLISSYLFYVLLLLRNEGHFGHIKKDVSWNEIRQDVIIVTGCIVALLLSTKWLLLSADKISSILNIPQFTVGLIILAFGTTMPELTISISSVLKDSSGIAFGDILGAIVCNSSLVLGISALINPITIGSSDFIPAALFMVTSVFIAILFVKKKEITWQEGIGLIMLYVTFLLSQAQIRSFFGI
ncbi:MAG: sodium:calcium antiporter [Nanoarchaeota archaeon]|nr:sodium:calcium antiporter [Nanoarchaeota archaeon]